jgi:sulfate adenylyltransferase
MAAVPLPQHCPSPRELDDLELLLSGALAPLRRFDEPGSAVTLDLPEDLREQEVELVDPEGLPLAHRAPDGTLSALAHPQYGPFRRLHLTPEGARVAHGGATWVPVRGPLTRSQVDALPAGPVVLLALAGTGMPEDLSPVGLVRATLAAAEAHGRAEVVVVPLASHGGTADDALVAQVVGRFADGDPVAPPAPATGAAEDWPDAVAAVVAEERPAPDQRGLVVLFTGLSGSGKSTIARALTDRVLEQGTRTVTSLDGDVVRRNLSAGLSFSRADRETNIRRIGWVAAEIARHGGLAVCSPIAPFDETRQQVRSYVEEAGGAFFLVHVATPLEECERRDRKGLYAKARRGEIPDFTGISSPYEEPEDAAVRVDTTGRSVEAVLEEVLTALRAAGHLDPA